jgi:fatty-acyl-CoA synthase
LPTSGAGDGRRPERAAVDRMPKAHFAHWPAGLPRHLTVPRTNLFFNVEVSAARFPDKPFIVFGDSALTFAEFRRQAERIAGFLQHDCGVRAGDRVLLAMQNSPQWALAFFGILRANAVVVPVNPMNRTGELRHVVADAGPRVALVAQDLLPQLQPLLGRPPAEHGAGLRQAIVAAYSDYLARPGELAAPAFVVAPRQPLRGPGLTPWAEMLAADRLPGPIAAGADDLAVLPYTSGTTGQPKGCMHTHHTVMTTAVQGVHWFGLTQDAVYLSALPYFHVTGMTGSLNGPLYIGATIVVLPRWNRDAAAAIIERHRVTVWQTISTALIDFLANPELGRYDLSSLSVLRGGGAAMPEAVCRKLKELTGLDYVEGYGMTETMAATHLNPPRRPKPQCLGVPLFDVDARVIDPDTLRELAAGETGEIVMHGPQVMRGYWSNESATREAFIEIDGRRFIRSGDLGRVDGDGYFFMADRLKRMINAAGYKVWPAEVEAQMYQHPAIEEVCVIGARDPRRGETVKAVVVLAAGHRGTITAQQIIDWAHETMAAYKCPRIVEFTDALPKSGTGKVLWRELQQRQDALDGRAGE